MTIENSIGTRRIELTAVDSMDELYPSSRIEVELKTDEIRAKFDRGIWLSHEDIEDFIVRLSKFDETREGVEGLKSMSPDEFRLEFGKLDDKGHVYVRIQLRKDSLVDQSYCDSIDLRFEIDPSAIGGIIAALGDLKTRNALG